jgi:hypothetical protein
MLEHTHSGRNPEKGKVFGMSKNLKIGLRRF